MKVFVLVLAFVAMAAAGGLAEENEIFNLYNSCSSAEGFSVCLKKKAISLLDQLDRKKRLYEGEGISITREENYVPAPATSEEQLEAVLPRALDAKDEALTEMAMDKFSKILGTTNLKINLASLAGDDESTVEEARKKKDKKGMGMGLMMLVAAKMAVLLKVKLALALLMAKKALIIGKIALIISAVIFFKKLLASKGHQETSYSVAYDHGGHGGHGGWEKRSIEEVHALPYSAYAPTL